MSTAMQAFHFLQPGWLWLLLGLPALPWLFLRAQDGRARLARLVDAELLPHLLIGLPRSRRLPAALLAAGWLLATLAMAGPSWSRRPEPLFAARAAQVVAVSLSQRMLARDVAPDRMARARYKAHDLLAANLAGLNGLVAYAGEAFVVAPLTSDAHSLGDLLDALAPDTMPLEGDDAAAAIRTGARLIRDARTGGGSLVLITDTADAAARAAAATARAQGVRVSVLGVGTRKGAAVPLDEGGFLQGAHGPVRARRDDAALAAVAAAGGGRYVPMQEGRGDIAALRGELLAGARTGTDASAVRWRDAGPWLLLPLLPLLALAFRRGWLLLLPLALGLASLPAPAHAARWADLWRRPDQQAMQALQAGRADEAERLARDPALRGAAAYRAGHYQAAIAALRPLHAADARYNLGNALARSGRYREAIDAYDQALAEDPRHADARANRAAVEDWLRHHPPSSHRQDGDSNRPPAGGNGKNGQGQQRGQQQGRQQDHPGDRQGQGHDTAGSDGRKAASPKNDADRQQGPEGGVRPPSAAQKARAEQARRALQKQMDRRVGKGKRAASAPHQLGAAADDDPQARLPSTLRQALQRVPDDPGALLRRKFELEYRQRHGGLPSEDGP